MSIPISLAAIVLVSVFLTPAVYSGQTGKSPSRENERLAQKPIEGKQFTPPRAGVPWREKVVKQRYIANRAADRRNALKRSAQEGQQEQTDEVSVSSYNSMIQKNNAQLRQQEAPRNTGSGAQPR